MNRLILTTALLSSVLMLNGQGAGFGFSMDFGYRGNYDVGEGYNQSLQTSNYNLFIRWFSKNGKRGHQFTHGLRLDSIRFKNNTMYLNEDLDALESYNVDAYLKRVAWRFGYIEQLQFFGTPGKFVLSANYGGYYEFTSQMKRRSLYDNIEYNLYSEQNRHNLIFTAGIEARLWFFTAGYKYEYMLFDMINHEYMKTQPAKWGNSSELRGLKLSGGLNYFYIAFHFDFFSKQESD